MCWSWRRLGRNVASDVRKGVGGGVWAGENGRLRRMIESGLGRRGWEGTALELGIWKSEVICEEPA